MDNEISCLAARLRASGERGDLSECRAIHAEILEGDFHRNKFLRNLLVDAYGSCGSVHAARLVFDSIVSPNVFSWNLMIKAYARNGLGDEAVEIYSRMQWQRNLQPNAHTYATVLGACRDLELGREIHSKIVKGGHDSCEIVATGLIAMYARCGSVEEAKEVFDQIRNPNPVSWTSMITSYAQNGYPAEAKTMLDSMPEPRNCACNAMITAFSNCKDVEGAKEVFDLLPHPNVEARTSMLVAYARNGYLEQARRIFDEMEERNVVSWNAMISAYTSVGYLRDARHLFDKMPTRDAVSWTCMIMAYAQNRNMLEGRKLFSNATTKDIVLWNAMLAGYSRDGDVDAAKALFDEISVKDTVSWNTLLAAYALNGHIPQAEALFGEIPRRDAVSWNTMLTAYAFGGAVEKAMSAFEAMAAEGAWRTAASWNIAIAALAERGEARRAIALVARKDLEGIPTDRLTLIALVVDSCTGAGAVERGRAIHLSVVEAGILLDRGGIAAAIANLYARHGLLGDARAVFDASRALDAEAWNPILAAAAGDAAGALDLFRTLAQYGVPPDAVSFVRVLAACSHAGLVHDAWYYFTAMARDFHVAATLDHYLCVVDALGRSGRLGQARELLESMPYEPDGVAWMTLLAACANHGDAAGGIESARRIFRLQHETSAPFVLLANICKQLGGIRYYELAMNQSGMEFRVDDRDFRETRKNV